MRRVCCWPGDLAGASLKQHATRADASTPPTPTQARPYCNVRTATAGQQTDRLATQGAGYKEGTVTTPLQVLRNDSGTSHGWCSVLAQQGKKRGDTSKRPTATHPVLSTGRHIARPAGFAPPCNSTSPRQQQLAQRAVRPHSPRYRRAQSICTHHSAANVSTQPCAGSSHDAALPPLQLVQGHYGNRVTHLWTPLHQPVLCMSHQT